MNKFHLWIKCNHKIQKGVAKELKISTSTLHEILRKGQDPSLRLAAAIEDYTREEVKMRDWLDQPAVQKKAAKKTKTQDRAIKNRP